jgi:hypothetical protein
MQQIYTDLFIRVDPLNPCHLRAINSLKRPGFLSDEISAQKSGIRMISLVWDRILVINHKKLWLRDVRNDMDS